MRVGNGNACCAFELEIEQCQSDPGPLPVAAAIHQFRTKWVSSRAGDKKADRKSTNGLMDIKRLAVRAQQQQQREQHEWEKRENRTEKDWKQIRIEKWNRNSSKLKLKLKCTTTTATTTIWVTHTFLAGPAKCKTATQKPKNNNTANIRTTRNRNRKNSPRDDGNCCLCCCWCCCCTQLAIIKCNWFETWLVNGYANRLCLIVRCNQICLKGKLFYNYAIYGYEFVRSLCRYMVRKSVQIFNYFWKISLVFFTRIILYFSCIFFFVRLRLARIFRNAPRRIRLEM